MRHVDRLTDLRVSGGRFWYLASPFSQYPGGHAEAERIVCEISDALDGAGIAHYCPIRETCRIIARAKVDPMDHEFFQTINRPWMHRAHGIVVATMDGWRQSKGVREELAYFNAAGKPVWLLDPGLVLPDE